MITKRKLCIILSFLLMCTQLWMPVSAVENISIPDTTHFNNKLAKAASAFPEYAEKICGKVEINSSNPMPLSLLSADIVIEEAREISETEWVSYIEYSNGISVTSIYASAGCDYGDPTVSGITSTYIVDAWLTCVGSSEMLFVSDISLVIANNGTNYISNPGTVATVDGAGSWGGAVPSAPMRYAYVYSGTSTRPAYVTYCAGFTLTASGASGPIEWLQTEYLTITVKNSAVYVAATYFENISF